MQPETPKQRAIRKREKRARAELRQEFNARRRGHYDPIAIRRALAERAASDLAEGELAAERTDDGRAERIVPQVFPAGNADRWVPIGPSTIRRGDAEGRPTMSGRVRALEVDGSGTRAYAGTAKGGVWYTSDGGSSWAPLGGWANEPRVVGGINNALSVGALLVSFGDTAADDFVMVGTGEQPPTAPGFASPDVALDILSVGVLAAKGPATAAIGADPWESATGIALFENVACYRLARDPTAVAGLDDDTIVAATSGGLFVGVRQLGTFAWSRVGAADAFCGATASVTDVAWLPLAAFPRQRLFVVFALNTTPGVATGVAFCDDVTDPSPTFTWVTGLGPSPANQVGRLSVAVNDDDTALYVLGELSVPPTPTATPTVWQIANPTAAAPSSAVLTNTPGVDQLWGVQRDYDQAITVTTSTQGGATRVDRVHLGGSLVSTTPLAAPTIPPGTSNWNAALYAFDVSAAGALMPVAGVSAVSVAPATDGADLPGWIGNGIHPDVHTIKVTDDGGAARQVWVGCDGGVFVSTSNGQTNTFAPRNAGLAAIEVGFGASHPTSSHYGIIGTQDNGGQARVGDTVWEVSALGDGGGVGIHRVQSDRAVMQYVQGDWQGRPQRGFVAPLRAPAGGAADVEHNTALAYTGLASVAHPAAASGGRIALGTNRVWLTDDLGSAAANTWVVLPYSPGAFARATDPRPARVPAPANSGVGVPAGGPLVTAAGLGPVVTVKWVTPTSLLALYQGGVVRYTEQPGSPGNWQTQLEMPRFLAALPAVNPAAMSTQFTDIAPVPGTNDFYLTTTGGPGAPPVDTCFYFNNTLAGGSGFVPTGLNTQIPPIDPAYSVVVDPTTPTTVYVGTVSGVWMRSRGGGGAFGWAQMVNGLPEAAIQDLSIWPDPGGPPSPVLLRAAVESRGVWEVDLSQNEAQRTYVRVHPYDDRRQFPTPLQDPTKPPAAAALPTLASPDIVIRPQSPVTTPPVYQGTRLRAANTPPYQLWSFQTAFRWRYPSIVADGQWSDMLGDLVERERAVLGLPPGRFIDKALWDIVVAATLDDAGNVAVYRAPWQTAATKAAPAGEIDVIDHVKPVSDARNVWRVYREPSLVEILLHHRDVSPVPPNGAFAVLLWQTNRSESALRAIDTTAVPAYATSLVGGGAPNPTPPGWNVVVASDGTPLHRLPLDLSARTPRAVAVPFDTSPIPMSHRVLLLALAGSSVDGFSAPPTGPVANAAQLVQAWPHAAGRLISVSNRPT